MMQLEVTLDFACCRCGQNVGVTLLCAGEGLSRGSDAVAAVKVPCPACCSVNQLYFEPSGTIRDVMLYEGEQVSLEPSLN